ncbi:MAG: hypothetical protein V4510_02380 [bacterium]
MIRALSAAILVLAVFAAPALGAPGGPRGDGQHAAPGGQAGHHVDLSAPDGRLSITGDQSRGSPLHVTMKDASGNTLYDGDAMCRAKMHGHPAATDGGAKMAMECRHRDAGGGMRVMVRGTVVGDGQGHAAFEGKGMGGVKTGDAKPVKQDFPVVAGTLTRA